MPERDNVIPLRTRGSKYTMRPADREAMVRHLRAAEGAMLAAELLATRASNPPDDTPLRERCEALVSYIVALRARVGG